MKTIKRTLIILAMFVIFSGNTFAEELKLACRYSLDDHDEEFTASIFLDTTNMTGAIEHSYIPIYGDVMYSITGNIFSREFNEYVIENVMRIDNKSSKLFSNSAKIFTDGEKYWFTLLGQHEMKNQYQIDRNDLSLSGVFAEGFFMINGKCTIVKNTTLI